VRNKPLKRFTPRSHAERGDCPLRLPRDRVRLCGKMRTVEAVVQPDGQVRLLEPLSLPSPRRALVTILEEPPSASDTALLSEGALAEDWNRPEEDAAWAHLQPGKSS
jgi:hypothetical protein